MVLDEADIEQIKKIIKNRKKANSLFRKLKSDVYHNFKILE